MFFFLRLYGPRFRPRTYRTGCKSNMGTVKKISFFWNRACCGREAFIAVFISGNLNPQSGTQICLARPCWKEDKTIFTFVVSNKSEAICDWKLGPKCSVNYEAVCFSADDFLCLSSETAKTVKSNKAHIHGFEINQCPDEPGWMIPRWPPAKRFIYLIKLVSRG